MFEFFGSIGSFIMTPLYYLVSVVLVGAHYVWGAVFGGGSGLAWVLSVITLTLLIRAALIPLFVKQIKSSRNMQLVQPQVKALQKKYGHDREKLAAETMALYKETGTNPFASCLPLIIQMPIFFALFRLIDHASKEGEGHGVLTNELAKSFADAPFFGGTLSESFTNSSGVGIKVAAAILVVLMTVTTFLTQRQLMSKNMPADAMTGPYANQQKMLLYVLPLVFAVGGIAFPIAVLFYWTTSNAWTMCQQFYVIRNNPAPNTEAFRSKQARDEEKRKRKGLPILGQGDEGEDPGDAAGGVSGSGPDGPNPPPKPVQRQQPKKQSRNQRKGGNKPSGAKPRPKGDVA